MNNAMRKNKYSLFQELKDNKPSLRSLEENLILDHIHNNVFKNIIWVNKIGEVEYSFQINKDIVELSKEELISIITREFHSENINISPVKDNPLEFKANWGKPYNENNKNEGTFKSDQLLYSLLKIENGNLLVNEAKACRDYFYDIVVPEIKINNIKGLESMLYTLPRGMDSYYNKKIIAKIAENEDIFISLTSSKNTVLIEWDKPYKEAEERHLHREATRHTKVKDSSFSHYIKLLSVVFFVSFFTYILFKIYFK